MDPFDPVRNEESNGNSKRRTSILKMPRKSIIATQVEQQESVLDCAKPSDKRISRRVSFALANDVLLFSKDAKNPSPLKTPLQELSAGSAAQNRVQMKATEDQQFTGIDILLNAPKQILQQKDTDCVYDGRNYGEKTMIFPAGDLDMTQSHTVRITNNEDFLGTSEGLLHNHGDKTVMFDRSMDMTLSQTLNMICDQDLTFSSKPRTPCVFPFTNHMTTYDNIDKENHVPKLNKSGFKKMSEPNISSKDDIDMPESNPFQCLFPQEIYAEPEKQITSTTSTDKKFTSETIENDSKRRLSVNYGSKDDGRSEKTIMFSDGGFMDITQNYTSNIIVAPSASSALDMTGLKERKSIASGLSVRPSEGQDDPLQCLFPLQERALQKDTKLHRDSSYQGPETTLKTNMPRHQIMTGSEEESQEKTVRFSTDQACMDVTRSHTVRISSNLHLQGELESLPLSGEKTVRFTTHDAGMDMTQCLTVNIARDLFPNSTAAPKQQEVTSLPDESVDLEFEKFFASLSGQNPKQKMQNMLTMNDSNITRALVERVETSADDTVNMDITEAHTGCISGVEKLYHNVQQTGKTLQQQRSILGTLPINGTESSRKSQRQRLPAGFDVEEPCRERTVRFAADEALMDVTNCHTVHISADLKPDLPCSEKTIRFDVNDAAMDVTQCHTVNIARDFPSLHYEDVGLLPRYGEKTVRFNIDDATMDMTRSQTVNIGFESNESFHCLPKYGEKTERINTAMDETQCLTVNIATEMRPKPCLSLTQMRGPDPEPQVDQNIYPTSGEKTLRFSVDADMDVTKSLTMVTNVAPQPIQDWDTLPRSEEKTVMFSSNEGGVEVTQCLTSNIGVETEVSHLDLSPVPNSITMDGPPALKKREPSIYSNRRCKSLGRHGLNAALNARRSVPWSNPLTQVTPTPGTDDKDFVKSTKTDVKNENIHILSVIQEKSIAEVSLKEKHVDDNMDENMTEALPVQIQRESIVDPPLKDLTLSAEDQVIEDPIAKCEMEIKMHMESPQRNTKNDYEPEFVAKPECPPITEKDSEAVNSHKSRRKSLADIQSKIRRFSQKLSAPSDDVVDVNIPVPCLDPEPKLEVDKNKLLQVEPDVDLEKSEMKSEALDEPFCAPTTPFKLETKQLMSRLSVVGFKPKLTKRGKSEEIKALDGSVQAASEPTKTQTIQVQNQADNFDLNVSDINDEELGSYEDVSEMLDAKSLDDGSKMSLFHEFDLDQKLQDDVFEEEFAPVNEKKRPLPDEAYIAEDEKRMKRSNDTIILDSQTCTLECDDNITTAANTQTTNSSNCSHTGNFRSDSTFESTSKESHYESQLEDYASGIQRKYNEGTLTMTEFFKLFYIDFVIHNSRQSVAPGSASSDTESTLMDLSRDRHISLPEQVVYEADVHNLTEQIEGLQFRKRDLEKTLTQVNRTLWEEMQDFSEAEFKSFGAKLKERHNFYRKMSKAKSHEMKEVLYADLMQANVEEQKKLSGSIQEADAMLKSLDDCIANLEADLAAIESDIKSQQQELNKVKETTSNNERSSLELEIQKKQSLNKLRRVKDETKDLDRHLTMLHTINEWKLVEITTNRAIYTFLYETLHLELTYEESEGNDEEKKIADISFKHLLDENSECHARLVHTMVSQFTQDKNLTEKYSTNKHVPEASIL
ncbi:uncharacterized protein knl1 [Periophthalmus magnuspinnatus]|uniref:uncharacterized protein knl1 n=1 Tax=Periophthalmus magnuspinnatus TaxID=409849 RepID=UPI0024370F65|nr:uncharacterized protein knl1 [Periophthalmus magnuspinnatus]